MNDYRSNGKRSLSVVERRITKHLTPVFSGWKMIHVSTDHVREYIVQRQTVPSVLVKKARKDAPEVRRPASAAEINRELALLKRMFSLAIQAGSLLHRPHIPMLKESNVRKGFFEADQLSAVLKHLPEAIRPVIQFAAITGWRIQSEVLPLEWRQVDWSGGEIRLDAGTTKHDEARTFPFTQALRTVLETQGVEHERLKKQDRSCRTCSSEWWPTVAVASRRHGRSSGLPKRGRRHVWLLGVRVAFRTT